MTMGTNALYTFVNLFPLERLFLTGFTFYGAAGSGQGVYWQDDRKSRGVFHDLEPEAQLLASIVARFEGEVEATSEVHELLRRYGGRVKAGAGEGRPARLDGLSARVGWQLIRWGMRLRRRAEARDRGRYSESRKSKANGPSAIVSLAGPAPARAQTVLTRNTRDGSSDFRERKNKKGLVRWLCRRESTVSGASALRPRRGGEQDPAVLAPNGPDLGWAWTRPGCSTRAPKLP